MTLDYNIFTELNYYSSELEWIPLKIDLDVLPKLNTEELIELWREHIRKVGVQFVNTEPTEIEFFEPIISNVPYEV